MSEDVDRLWTGSMPETYDRYLGPAVFLPHAIDLARRAAALGASDVLEVAAGTGLLTRALAEALPAARITATDLSEAMVRYASSRIDGVAWRQADAMALPYDDESFDLVVCQFGVMFFPDKPAAFREVARVLAPGGRFLFNTWGVIERNDFAAALAAGIARAFPEGAPTFLVRIPHGYTDVDQVSSDLRAAGLHVDEVTMVTLTGHADSSAQLATGFCQGTPLRLEIEERGSLAEITRLVADELSARLGAGPLAGDLTAHVVTARR
jgi:SAM-dependent methyltransferase